MNNSTSLTMQALQLTQPRCFTLVQVPIPVVQGGRPGKLLVRLKWALVCASDIPRFAGTQRSLEYPLAPGRSIHECVGEVVESTSDSISVGETVVAIPDDYRGLAEFFTATDSASTPLPPDLVDCDASTLVQPLATVIYGVDRLGGLHDRSVAVIGLGPIGLMFCWLLAKRGTGKVIGIDPIPWRCDLARRLGAAKTYAQPSLELIHATRVGHSDWEAPDICVEAVGHQTATINDCLELVRDDGTVLAFGVVDDAVYPFEYELFYRKNLHMQAAVAPDWAHYLPAARDLFSRHRKELEVIVTHRFPIRQAEEAYTLYERRQSGVAKVLLDATRW